MNNVVNVLADLKTLLDASLSGAEVFCKAKDPAHTGAYVVLDHEPFNWEEAVGNALVHIRMYAPNLPDGRPDLNQLYNLRDQIVPLIPEDLYLNGYYVDIQSVSDAMADEADSDNSHFITIETIVTYNNLKFE